MYSGGYSAAPAATGYQQPRHQHRPALPSGGLQAKASLGPAPGQQPQQQQQQPQSQHSQQTQQQQQQPQQQVQGLAGGPSGVVSPHGAHAQHRSQFWMADRVLVAPQAAQAQVSPYSLNSIGSAVRSTRLPAQSAQQAGLGTAGIQGLGTPGGNTIQGIGTQIQGLGTPGGVVDPSSSRVRRLSKEALLQPIQLQASDGLPVPAASGLSSPDPQSPHWTQPSRLGQTHSLAPRDQRDGSATCSNASIAGGTRSAQGQTQVLTTSPAPLGVGGGAPSASGATPVNAQPAVAVTTVNIEGKVVELELRRLVEELERSASAAAESAALEAEVYSRRLTACEEELAHERVLREELEAERLGRAGELQSHASEIDELHNRLKTEMFALVEERERRRLDHSGDVADSVADMPEVRLLHAELARRDRDLLAEAVARRRMADQSERVVAGLRAKLLELEAAFAAASSTSSAGASSRASSAHRSDLSDRGGLSDKGSPCVLPPAVQAAILA